jgi:hypothetical protein
MMIFQDIDLQVFDNVIRIEVLNNNYQDYFDRINEMERRLGNILINKLHAIKQADFKRDKNKTYFLNDKRLKAKMDVSRRKIKGLLGNLLLTFARMIEPEIPPRYNRLKEIEEEMIEEKARENREAYFEEIAKAERQKYNRYNYGKGD